MWYNTETKQFSKYTVSSYRWNVFVGKCQAPNNTKLATYYPALIMTSFIDKPPPGWRG